MGREGGDLALEFQVPCRISEWAGNPGRTGPTTAVAMGGKASVGRPYAAEVAARGATIQAGGRKGSGPDRRTPKDARDVPSQTGRTGPLVVNQWARDGATINCSHAESKNRMGTGNRLSTSLPWLASGCLRFPSVFRLSKSNAIGFTTIGCRRTAECATVAHIIRRRHPCATVAHFVRPQRLHLRCPAAPAPIAVPETVCATSNAGRQPA